MSELPTANEHDATPPPDGGAGASAEPGSWLEALSLYVNSRIDLVRLESRAASRLWGRAVALLALGAAALGVSWLLLMAGAVGLLAAATGWPWFAVAIAAAGLHALAGIICLLAAAARKARAFPLTRQEFAKDRQWLTSLTTRRK
jgi:uncharacterized membrane protein YqjE